MLQKNTTQSQQISKQIVAGVYSANTKRQTDGVVAIGGVRVNDLIAEYGSPLYVVDEADFCERAKKFHSSFASEFSKQNIKAKIYYASKAFLCVGVAKWVQQAGLGIDVSSLGELEVALAAGINPNKIGVHGNNKSRAELERAISVGVGSIVLDSAQEIGFVQEIAAELQKTVRVLLRVNSGVHASTHSYLATSHEDQKFGVPATQANTLVQQIIESENLAFIGLHCHIGSQIFNTSGFAESADRMVEIIANLPAAANVQELNLGGGFGIAYTPEENSQAPEISSVAKELAATVAAALTKHNIVLDTVAFEPGRYIAGPAGTTLYTVGNLKEVALAGSDADSNPQDRGSTSRLYVSVDGGMSDNARPALYGAQYTARIANRQSTESDRLVRIVGKHCETGDIVIDREFLPADIATGDILAVAATGAYCWSLASNYNYLPRPAVVAVKKGAAHLLVRGETVQQLLAKSVY